jgi:hypothetical protein
LNDEKQIIHDLALIVVQHQYGELMNSTQARDVSYEKLAKKLVGYYNSAVTELQKNAKIINSAYDNNNSST